MSGSFQGQDARLILDALLDAIADRVVERMGERSARDIEFVDQTTAPIARASYLKAAAKGSFASSKIGRRVVAKRADVLAWIESRRRATRAAPTDDEADLRRAYGLAPTLR